MERNSVEVLKRCSVEVRIAIIKFREFASSFQHFNFSTFQHHFFFVTNHVFELGGDGRGSSRGGGG